MRITFAVVWVLVSILCGFGCGKKDVSSQPAEVSGQGSLVFTANGEDFVRQGFVDKQGWHIDFEKLYVNIVNPAAYGDPGEAELKGEFLTDLAEGEKDAPPIRVGSRNDIKAGNYQSLKFKIRRAAEGEFKGSSIIMTGTAVKGDTRVPFVIRLDEEMDFDGKEGYVGDEVKGMLSADGKAEVEMTFHFDHIFGDIEAAADDHINTGSVGFDFFNAFAKEGKVNVSQAELKSSDTYDTLCHAMWTLGHLGEGHCECTNQSSVKK